MTLWAKLLLLLVAGYLTLTRSFAHFGVPGANLFIGEMAIATFLLFQPHAVLENWFTPLQPTRSPSSRWRLPVSWRTDGSNSFAGSGREIRSC